MGKMNKTLKFTFIIGFFLVSLFLVSSSHTNDFALFENPDGINATNLTLYGFGITFPDGTTQTTSSGGGGGSGSPWQIGTDIIFNDTANVKVGIGTASPSEKLDVQGGDFLLNGTSGTSSFVLTDDGSNAYRQTFSTQTGSNLRWKWGTSDLDDRYMLIELGGGDNRFHMKGRDMVIRSTLKNPIAIFKESSGFVGIGTNSPDVALDVIGSVNIDEGLNVSGISVFQTTTDSINAFQIRDTDGGLPIFNVDTTNERVGIKTTSPVKDLHIVSTVPTIRLSDSDAATDQAVATLYEFYRGDNLNRVGFVGMGSSSNDVLIMATDYAAGEIKFATSSNVVAMTINNNSNIIIDSLSGSYSNGEAYVCVYDNGTIFAKDTACS